MHLGSLSFQHPAFSTSCIPRRCSQPCSRYRGARTPLRCLQLHVWSSASFAESWVITHFFHSLLSYTFLNQLWLPPFSLLVYAFILAQQQQKGNPNLLPCFLSLIHGHRYFYHAPCYAKPHSTLPCLPFETSVSFRVEKQDPG